jgi:hypothetical protein
VPCLNPYMTWKLDPREVGWGTSGYSNASGFGKGPARHTGTPARRELTVHLVHLPTGITVEKKAVGPFTRKQAREARARLYTELFPLLEDKVARALRIPGR